MTLGERIRSFRRAQGLSQRDFAQQAGISYQTVCNWEHGLVRAPRPESLHALQKVLNLSQRQVLDLMGLGDTKGAPQAA